MKKYSILIIIILLGIIIGLIALLVQKQEPAPQVSGIITFEDCERAGYQILDSNPRQCQTPDGRTFVEQVSSIPPSVEPAPSVQPSPPKVEDLGNTREKANLIKVSNVAPSDTVYSPLLVRGEARGNWFFEATFPLKIVDSNGQVLGQWYAEALSDWQTENFVPFEAILEFKKSTTAEGELILEKDNPSGLAKNDDALRFPIKFYQGESLTLKSYFNNSKKDPSNNCEDVFAVNRIVPKTQAVARAALDELLKGVMPSEKDDGFTTQINRGVEIQKLTIENGVAKVDFNEQLEFGVAGSCRVLGIRAQIEETLKQFPTINDVEISINGKSEGILQP